LIFYISSPNRKISLIRAFVIAAILYAGTLLSSPYFVKAFYDAGEVLRPETYGSPLLFFGFFANPFLALTFLLISVRQPSKKFSIYALAVSLAFSVICAFLYAFFSLHLD
jgi:hypothetical protein